MRVKYEAPINQLGAPLVIDAICIDINWYFPTGQSLLKIPV